ncbi:hypothetical protein OAG36_00880 [bacterium]|jgi:hypothetical protein|nr:hypothetical protein [bacterium]
MSVSDLIKSAIDKDANNFETSFNNIMADRMTSAIGQKYDSMYGASDVGEPVEMEAQVDPVEPESE